MWRYQVVEIDGARYCLTRLGFGLNAAPKIMNVILKNVLSLDNRVEAATDSYIDDIIVDEGKLDAESWCGTWKDSDLLQRSLNPWMEDEYSAYDSRKGKAE